MRKIPLTQGKVAIVSDKDYSRLSKFKWCANKIGKYWYAVRGVWKQGKTTAVLMHREVFGGNKSNVFIDHINRNGLDNRRSNLRLCSHKLNQRNRGPQINNSSGYKGVSWSEARQKWVAVICVNGKRISLGRHKSKIEAARAYDRAARKYHGPFAYQNLEGV